MSKLEQKQIFISYAYTGKDSDGQFYQGFGNMLGDFPVEVYDFDLSNEEFVDDMHIITTRHCIETMGMKTAHTTVLYWKEMKE